MPTHNTPIVWMARAVCVYVCMWWFLGVDMLHNTGQCNGWHLNHESADLMAAAAAAGVDTN